MPKSSSFRPDSPNVLPYHLHRPFGYFPAQRVQIFSTITPISNTKFTGSITPLVVVLNRWRTQLIRLRNAGWGPVTGRNDSYFGLLMNCRPTPCRVGILGHDGVPYRTDAGAVRDFRLKQCRHPNICPWCWARRAGNVWEQVSRLLFPGRTALDDEMERPEATRRPLSEISRAVMAEMCHDYDIYVRSESWRLGPYRWVDNGQVPYDDRLRQRVQWRRDVLVPAFNAYALLESYSLAGDSQNEYPEVKIRQLIVYPAGKVVPEALSVQELSGERTIKAKLEKFETPTRDEAVRAVAAVCRYPIYFLESEDTHQVDDLYKTMKLVRPVVYFGAFRGVKSPGN